MVDYLSLERKYRPSTFEEVHGQEHVCRLVKQRLASNTFPACSIFYGPPGCGKTTLARLVATSLNPDQTSTVEKDAAEAGKVDYIRSLKTDMYHSPWTGHYKTYIIEEAHRLSAAAFDSLLKMTEEPPSHVKFILTTTSLNKIPGALRSRSKKFGLTLVPTYHIKNRLIEICRLEGSSINSDMLDLVVESGGGSMRDAIVSLESVITSITAGDSESEILASLGLIGSKNLSKFVGYYLFGKYRELCESIPLFLEEYIDINKAIHDLQQFLMDVQKGILLVGSTPDAFTMDTTSIREEILTKQAESGMGPKEYNKFIGCRLNTMFDISQELLKDLSITTNKKAALERFIVRLGMSWKCS